MQVAGATAKEDLNRASRDLKSYQQLLAQLRLYVDSADCPACGSNFPTREELLQRIDHKIGSESPALVTIASTIQAIGERQNLLQNQIHADREMLDLRREAQEASRTVAEWTRNVEALRATGTHLNLSIGADIPSEIGLLTQALLNSRHT